MLQADATRAKAFFCLQDNICLQPGGDFHLAAVIFFSPKASRLGYSA